MLGIIALLSPFFVSAQQSFYKAPSGTATTNVRAPNGSSGHTTLRGCFIVTAAELAGISTVTQLNALGFHLINGTGNTPVTGTIQIYLENTSDVTYNKGNTWANVISSMTSVYNDTMTIPTGSTVPYVVNLMFPAAFTYTGGGLYVAYDWISNGPFQTTTVVANYQCQTNITNGGASAASSSTVPPTSVGITNFRPNFNFGYINTFTNEASVKMVRSHGKIPLTHYAPYTFTAVVKNKASVTMTNVPVDLYVTGANTYSTTTIVPSIAAGATVNVLLPGFTPTAQGMHTVTAVVPPDQNNANNSASTTMSVTCETLINTPPEITNAQYNSGVGFNTASGIIYNQIRPTINTSVTAINIFIANNPASVGKPIYCVLGNSSGMILAYTNTITITNAMLSTWQTFYFATPYPVLANTVYYSGLALPVGTPGYFPLGAASAEYVPTDIYYTAILTGSFPFAITQNLGYFGFETLFHNGINLTVSNYTICSGATGQMTLSASGASTYSWSTSATTESIVVPTPSTTTSYTVIGKDGSGNCYVKKQATILVNITPTVSVPVGGICPVGGSHTFVPSGAATYTIEGGNWVVSPTVTTTYSVAGTSSAGCISAPITTSVIVTNSPSVSIITPTGICVGQSATLTAQGAASYSWTTGSTLNPIVVSPTVSNTYGVLGTVGSCTAFVTDLLIVNPNPTINIVASNTTACLGGTPPVTLTASGAQTYTWSTMANTPSIVVSPTTTSGYIVYGSDINGCSGQKNLLLPVSPSPTITASSSADTICVNNTATLTASGGVNYQWSGSPATTNTLAISPSVTTVYTVTGYAANGCYGTYTVMQIVDPCAGIKEINGLTLRALIYPNPSAGLFTIQLSEISESTVIEVYGASGQMIGQFKMQATTHTINLTESANGVYHLLIKDNNQVMGSLRIVKQGQ